MSDASLSIRPLRDSDLPNLAQMHRASILDLVAGSYSPELVDAWVARISEARYGEARAEGHAFWVAESDGELAGFGSQRRAEISSLYVAPGFVRRGVGTALLARLEAEARAAGARELFVVASRNSVSFYSRHGYTAEREVLDPIGNTGLSLPGVQMVKVG